MAALFRLVKYYNLPRYMMHVTYQHTHKHTFMYIELYRHMRITWNTCPYQSISPKCPKKRQHIEMHDLNAKFQVSEFCFRSRISRWINGMDQLPNRGQWRSVNSTKNSTIIPWKIRNSSSFPMFSSYFVLFCFGKPLNFLRFDVPTMGQWDKDGLFHVSLEKVGSNGRCGESWCHRKVC